MIDDDVFYLFLQKQNIYINSSQWRVAGFRLDKVVPPQLEAAALSGMLTRGAGLRQLRGMGSERFVLNVDLDTDFRFRCE
jgi:hypothetical protein